MNPYFKSVIVAYLALIIILVVNNILTAQKATIYTVPEGKRLECQFVDK